MKKIWIVFILAGLLTSCYDDFIVDFPWTTVAFSTSQGGSPDPGVLQRTVVIGEGLKLEFGCYLAGVLENTEERWAEFIIDPSLLSGTSYTLMPGSMYTMSNNDRFVIPKGEYIGSVEIVLDSTAFLNDPMASGFEYAIPFRLTSTSVDSINSAHDTKIVVLKYINRYEGYYEQLGTYVTKDAAGTEINFGQIENLIEANTLALDTVILNGAVYSLGPDYFVKAAVNADNSVYLEKSVVTSEPITVPYNLAHEAVLTTNYVSGWESLEAVRNDVEPISSTSRDGQPVYGNWPSAGEWRYLQYEFPGPREVTSAEIYWFHDGGGIQLPNDSKIEYQDLSSGEWVEVSNPVGLGLVEDAWNVTTFDAVVTYAIRYSFVGPESTGVHEYRVFGIPKTVYPEQAIMETVTANGSNTWDPVNNKLMLDYKVTYKGETYYTEVSTELVWRNRIRDGVNEWRR